MSSLVTQKYGCIAPHTREVRRSVAGSFAYPRRAASRSLVFVGGRRYSAIGAWQPSHPFSLGGKSKRIEPKPEPSAFSSLARRADDK